MISGIVQYFKESQAELKKVIWPRRDEVVRHTASVIALGAFVAFMFYVLDQLFIGVVISFLGA